MGTPVEPIEFVRDCLVCFLPGRTPKTVKVVFAGIENCPGYSYPLPNARLFTLTQDPDYPCSWYNVGDTDFLVMFLLTGDYSELTCHQLTEPFQIVFGSIPPTTCQYVFFNELTCEVSRFTGGTGRVISQTDDIPNTLAESYGMTGMSTVLFDRALCGIDHQVVKLARRSDRTNVLIYCDNQEFLHCVITGTLDPNIAGDYFLSGVLNLQNYYQLKTYAWYIWWNGIDSWFISLFIGLAGDDYWQRTDPNINGNYTPHGSATGTATVLCQKV